MLSKQLEQLAAIEKAATPAPWASDHDNPNDCVIWYREEFLANVGSDRMIPVIESPREALVFDIDRANCILLAALRNAAPQFIAVAKAAQGLRNALQARAERADRLPHKTGCICHWCEQIEIATDILFAANDTLSAALPSVKGDK